EIGGEYESNNPEYQDGYIYALSQTRARFPKNLQPSEKWSYGWYKGWVERLIANGKDGYAVMSRNKAYLEYSR
ncbi:hypothetical protein, partial [Streptococcus pneumoniae]|uniref:hypothetical protein n=1 Tax=Streptococcus pneumoniae TaxID=1313 RepID=UPI001E45181E